MACRAWPLIALCLLLAATSSAADGGKQQVVDDGTELVGSYARMVMSSPLGRLVKWSQGAASTLKEAAAEKADCFQNNCCRLVEAPVEHVRQVLKERIVAQDEAIEDVLSALEGQLLVEKGAQSQPVVLLLAGPTGVGKTDSGHLLVEALNAYSDAVPHSERRVPRGLVEFIGSDYQPSSMDGAVERYREEMGVQLRANFARCGGVVQVLFDEVQKAAPGALDPLLPLMRQRPWLKVREKKEAMRRVVILLITDIGAADVLRLLLRYGSRAAIPRKQLDAVVKDALNAQWGALALGKHVSQIIHFLPMEPVHVANVTARKLAEFGARLAAGKAWQRLVVTPAFARHLCSASFVTYDQFTDAATGARKLVARYGARDVVLQNVPAVRRLLRRVYMTSSARSPTTVVRLDVTAAQAVTVSACPRDAACHLLWTGTLQPTREEAAR